jgi:hypothetical protein
MAETSLQPSKQWRKPELRKLSIAATSSATDKFFNEGSGQGKGDSGPNRVS